MGTVNSACIRSDSNHKVTSSVGEPLKGHRSPARIVRKSSRSDDFWNSSTLDKDNSGAQSGESYSTANETLEVGGSGNGNIPSEFVNHGLLLWNQSRQQWLRNKKSENHGSQLHKPRSNPLSWSATYDSLLTSNKRFTKPIPLAMMVDFLVDIWDQEGMYD
ncbi:uncharacterized protein LOC108225428 isoform X3 [Daucus carota subsp. sativus]|uniref:uncharacterized protein LOC108225428 isoform X3 n=1 Tax=Daucus carota subsp. sativus TaxID=79200 RepID=UPI0007EFACDC|nr:PREDICTED: uncharacterized protein LOC108225428 isoform X1 [Daucus carota subsp. sativus]